MDNNAVSTVDVSGEVEAVLFRNDENGYSVLKVKDENSNIITLTGCIPFVYPGEGLIASGIWENSQYGRQLKVSFFQQIHPDSEHSIYSFLSSGVFKGIGPATASMIVNKYGINSLYIIECEWEKLTDIKGISHLKAENLHNEFIKHDYISKLIEYICSFGLRPVLAMRLFRFYGDEAFKMLHMDPYVIASSNIGGKFAEADRFALETGIEEDSDVRIKAAAVFELRHNLNNGHCFIPYEKLIAATARMIDVAEDNVKIAVDSLSEIGSIVIEQIAGCRACFLPELYLAETDVTEEILSRTLHPIEKTSFSDISHPNERKLVKMMDDRISEIEHKNGFNYSDEQREAINTVCRSKVSVITGGPGTGKTTIINAVLDILEGENIKTYLTAPTGRAAKRMSELTSRDAYTIHRLLGAKIAEDGQSVYFEKNESDHLDCDAVILDECSMVDILLMSAFLKALPADCRVVLVGDADQLPSVGPGNVFSAIIRSGVVPTVHLKTIFRQSENSRIIENAHLINSGIHPDFSDNKGDFFRLKRLNSKDALSTICDLYSTRLPNNMKFAMTDIQVISPSRKGNLGTVNINQTLQSVLNPQGKDKKEVAFGSYIYREGDKIMQVRNNYDVVWENHDGSIKGNGIYNGDIGTIMKIDLINEQVLIDFEGKWVKYGFDSLIEIEHAWAITVHKAQGNEFNAVILALSSASSLLLTRDVFYTAVTRAKNLLVMVGDDEIAYQMIDNYRQTKRYSALKHRLVSS